MKLLLILIVSLAAVVQAAAQSAGCGYSNPVLPGFYPDPSVCRVGDTYYLANSSFHFFPGVPLHRSADLVHWEPAGHCLTRRSQLDLTGANFWLGVYAPNLVYHDGRLYMVTTNVPHGNFYVWTDDPEGEWSEPVAVEGGRDGIDPDLFFDGGRCYYVSTVGGAIRLHEIDIATGRRLTESREIWRGTGGRHPEGPHLFKYGGRYYLMIAEGGTEYGHKVTVARGDSPYGPFEPNPRNPILSHAGYEGASSPIQGLGHADLIEAHDGSWWMVALGFRPQSYNHHLLGRETFLAPVEWSDDGWPVVNGGRPLSPDMAGVKTLPQSEPRPQRFFDGFDGGRLGCEWVHICNPAEENYSLRAREGFLRLTASDRLISDYGVSPTAVCRRQRHIDCRVTVRLDAAGLREGGEAGVAVHAAPDYQYVLSAERRAGGTVLRLVYRLGMLVHTECEVPLDGDAVSLRIEAHGDYYGFAWSADGRDFAPLGRMNTRFLSSETAGGFTGTVFCLFAQRRGGEASYADFDSFDYEPLDGEDNENDSSI